MVFLIWELNRFRSRAPQSGNLPSATQRVKNSGAADMTACGRFVNPLSQDFFFDELS